MGAGGLLLFLGAVILYQLADRDSRNGWIWAGAYLAGALLLSRLTGLVELSIYGVFVACFVAMFFTKSLRRR